MGETSSTPSKHLTASHGSHCGSEMALTPTPSQDESLPFISGSLTFWGLRVNSGKLVTVPCSEICVILINFIYSDPKVFHIFVFSTNSGTNTQIVNYSFEHVKECLDHSNFFIKVLGIKS